MSISAFIQDGVEKEQAIFTGEMYLVKENFLVVWMKYNTQVRERDTWEANKNE